MSDALVDRATSGTEEVHGFFGAEELPRTDELDPGTFTLVDGFLEQHPGGKERLIPLLHHAQAKLGHLPFPVQEYVAEKLGLSPVQVWGVVSFYHFFTTTPRARNQFKVCMGTACFVRGGQQVLDGLKDACQTEVGGISEDRLFNLDQVRCIGACGLAPAITVNDNVHGNLTPQKARKLARRLRRQAKKDLPEGEGS
jgi:NADH-quinone oxidoreductase subunit E/NADP-reducing hydrogenase subunit HndA